MLVKTKYFGEINLSEDKIITMDSFTFLASANIVYASFFPFRIS